MIQIIKHKCCGKIFAGCCEPECYTEKDWLKNLREYALRGDIIEMAERGSVKFSKCECKDAQKVEEPNLFSELEQ